MGARDDGPDAACLARRVCVWRVLEVLRPGCSALPVLGRVQRAEADGSGFDGLCLVRGCRQVFSQLFRSQQNQLHTSSALYVTLSHATQLQHTLSLCLSHAAMALHFANTHTHTSKSPCYNSMPYPPPRPGANILKSSAPRPAAPFILRGVWRAITLSSRMMMRPFTLRLPPIVAKEGQGGGPRAP